MKINFKVASTSLVCVMADFPRGAGNYMRINYDGLYCLVVNLSFEDFKDIERLGLCPDGIECKVIGYNGDKAIYVVDNRIPEKCLTPFWRYGLQNKHVVNIIKSVFDIEDCGCIYDSFPELRNKIRVSSSYDREQKPGYVIRTDICSCCEKPHVSETKAVKPSIQIMKGRTKVDSDIVYCPDVSNLS